MAVHVSPHEIQSLIPSGTYAVVQAWNALRREVLEEAVRERLLPALEGEARARLAADAREAALADASDRLWELAKQAPLYVRTPRTPHGPDPAPAMALLDPAAGCARTGCERTGHGRQAFAAALAVSRRTCASPPVRCVAPGIYVHHVAGFAVFARS